ncbi:MAG: sigma 54-interacting transcriptional regulator [Colwellia sp.]|nr:sigma 54-interacting transcriptional regulator [Colwellia sp.]
MTKHQSNKNTNEQYNSINNPSAYSKSNMQDIREGLVFDYDNASISLFDMPMLLLHTHSLAVFRHELIESLGVKKARNLLFRMGHQSGTHDAKAVIKHRSHLSDEDFFVGGPQLHAFTGMSLSRPIKTEIDVSKGRFYMEHFWERSTEAEMYIETYGNESPFPVCWMQLGYASGYASLVMGRPVIYKEIKCQAQGAEHCVIIGKLEEDWDQEDEILSENCSQKHHYGDELDTSIYEPDDLENSLSPNIIGASEVFRIVSQQLKKISKTNATVLFQGESGVGKELYAKQLHEFSDRKDKPFISINCAAIPEDILEAELFGVEKGAFTGANKTRPGRFERADGGTIFLDEIGLLSYSAQGKLLRVLQELEIERLGGEETIKVDVRVIAATNEDLYSLSNNSARFRKDLFYRLNVCPIYIPPLRDRTSDIPLLMVHFLKKYTKKHNKNIPGFTNKTVRALVSYHWEGNIRELENYIERCIILSDDHKPICIDDFPSFRNATQYTAPMPPENDFEQLCGEIKRLVKTISQEKPAAAESETIMANSQHTQQNLPNNIEHLCQQLFQCIKEDKGYIDDIMDHIINSGMEEAHGNITEAGRLLGMTRARVAHRLKRIDVPDAMIL